MDAVKDFLLDDHKPIVVADKMGVITFINKAFEELFLWKAEELINEPLLIIIPANLHDAHNLGFSRFISTETPMLLDKPLKLAAVNKNGEQFDAIHLIRAVKGEQGWMFGANIYLPEG